MTYPGNTSLAEDVQGRILEAYRHSLESAAAGNRQEALLGCDFIQRLDPQFELEGAEATPATRSFTAAAPGLVSTFTRLLEARRLEELLAAAQSQSAAVAGDPKLRELVSQAQSRFEAEPLVRQLLDRARKAVGAGQLDEVAQFLDQARELDSTHPGLAEIERLRSSAASLPTSLTIDWEEDEGVSAVPPPSDMAPKMPAAGPADGAESTFSAPELPAMPAGEAVDPPTFEVRSGELASPAGTEPQPVEAAATGEEALDDSPSSLELPEIDFSTGEEPPAGIEPGLLDVPAAAPAEEAGETGARVQSLLDEGEAAYERGEFQAAIDSWSRIFLIDIDNTEAAQRIEKARQLKAESEREVEEIFHGGVARFDAGEWQEAREAFRKVIEIQPSYVLAREYLDKIGEREAGGGEPSLDLPEIAPATFGEAVDGEAEAEPGLRRRGGEILVPPEPGAEQEAQQPAIDGFAVRARRGALPSLKFLAIGGAVLALLAAGAWLLLGNWDRLFPNARPAAPTAPAPDPIAQARSLQDEGKSAVAIAKLRQIPPQSPRYAEAQSLISQWEKLGEDRDPDAEPTAEELERRALLERASVAIDAGENLRARRLYTEAAAIAPLDGEAGRKATLADQNLAVFTQEMSLMRDGEYEMALNRLWRLHEEDPTNLDTRRLMVDSYYNLTISDLRRSAPKDARKKIKEARELDRDDPMLERLERFCAAYERRSPDLLYRIFVKYLPER
jgi:tetratricopeptide (TPR) repeat protein